MFGRQNSLSNLFCFSLNSAAYIYWSVMKYYLDFLEEEYLINLSLILSVFRNGEDTPVMSVPWARFCGWFSHLNMLTSVPLYLLILAWLFASISSISVLFSSWRNTFGSMLGLSSFSHSVSWTFFFFNRKLCFDFKLRKVELCWLEMCSFSCWSVFVY